MTATNMEKALEESEVQLLFDKFDGVDSVLRHIGSYPYRCFFVARHMSRCTNLFLLHSSSVFRSLHLLRLLSFCQALDPISTKFSGFVVGVRLWMHQKQRYSPYYTLFSCMNGI